MKEFNFYGLGKKYATEILEKMAKRGTEVKNKFGEDAQLDFEAGIISTISDYEYVSDQSFNGSNERTIKRNNNSHFGGYGIITNNNISVVYNGFKGR